ncbi:MAG: hypothetical protein CM1200mP26_04180 [Acidimicrobiales bacterium]|nr:MAG: hypothetical protein CM1200mP26_04180 [Acidimicrobiales bacterium]
MTGERQAIEVHEATEVNDALVAAMARLIPQLSNSSPPPDVDALEAIVSSNASVLLLAVDPVATGEEAILGSMTLVVFRIPTGLRAWIEDVVVDEAAGVGGRRDAQPGGYRVGTRGGRHHRGPDVAPVAGGPPTGFTSGSAFKNDQPTSIAWVSDWLIPSAI